MEILTLMTKKDAFDKFASGILKEERRYITPSTQKKFIDVTPTQVTIRIYDAIRFICGNKKDASKVLIKINSTELDYEPDEDGYIQLEEDDSGNLHIIEASMIYSLGDILKE